MTKRLVLTAVALGVLGGVALAQTPWGGEDDGFIPPNKPTASCENALAKALAKAVVCVAKCHQSRATGKIADEAGEEACETDVANPASCKSKYNKTRDKLAVTQTCPTCLTDNSATAMDQIFAQGEAFIDSTVNGQIYCAQ
jgi:hypothetical protein